MKKYVSKTRLYITSAVCFLVAVLLTLTAVYVFAGDFFSSFAKIAEIDTLVKNNFYGDLSDADFDTALCDGYISELDDKYATYLTTEETEKQFDSFKGYRAGVGMTIAMHPDTYEMCVLSINEGSPAEKAGIKAGDVIYSVNGETVTRENYSDSFKKFSGNIGESVNAVISRDGEKSEITVTFADYEIQSVYYKTVDGCAYIKITAFNDKTVVQFKNAVDRAVSENALGLIFDITDNGGGMLDSVTEMLDYILPEGNLVSVEYADGKRTVLYKSDEQELCLPMAVLVNENTASASELFAASVRDYKKGVLIGKTTYGKGVMQQTYKLHDGSSVKFTVAKYFSASEESYDGVGLVPDYEITLDEDQTKYYYFLEDGENPYIQRAVDYINEVG